MAGGQGFRGDLLTAPVEQVRGRQIDYLMLDYLAEVTMSILQKQKSRDSNARCTRDFVSLMREILPDCVERNIRVTVNAGGVNVEGFSEAVREVAAKLGLSGKLKIGMVMGDDILPRLNEFLGSGIAITSMDTGESLSAIHHKVWASTVSDCLRVPTETRRRRVQSRLMPPLWSNCWSGFHFQSSNRRSWS